MALVCKAQASTWWLDAMLVCLVSGQVFTSIWSSLPPVFQNTLLTNRVEKTLRKDTILFKQVREKHPSASDRHFSKNISLACSSLRALSLLTPLPDPGTLTSKVSTRTSAVTKGQRGVGNFTKSTSRKFCRKRSRFLAS